MGLKVFHGVCNINIFMDNIQRSGNVSWGIKYFHGQLSWF